MADLFFDYFDILTYLTISKYKSKLNQPILIYHKLNDNQKME